MRKVFFEPDGTTWIANTKKDEVLYESPVNPPNTGTEYTRGTDLYIHKTKSHGDKFFFYHWSMWQGEEENIVSITKERAQEFLFSVMGDYWDFPSDADKEFLAKYGFTFEETA